MKYKIFDVIELNDGNKVTIVDINKSEIKVNIVDKNGTSQGFDNIKQKDIKRIIYTNN